MQARLLKCNCSRHPDNFAAGASPSVAQFWVTNAGERNVASLIILLATMNEGRTTLEPLVSVSNCRSQALCDDEIQDASLPRYLPLIRKFRSFGDKCSQRDGCAAVLTLQALVREVAGGSAARIRIRQSAVHLSRAPRWQRRAGASGAGTGSVGHTAHPRCHGGRAERKNKHAGQLRSESEAGSEEKSNCESGH